MTDAPKYTRREGQKFSGFVRSHLAVIEAEMAAGIKQEQILEEIQAQTDFKDVKLETLRMSLYRAREWASQGKRLPAQAQSAAPSPAPGPAPEQAASQPPAIPGVKFASTAKSSFDYSPTKPGQDLSHLLGTEDKGKK